MGPKNQTLPWSVSVALTYALWHQQCQFVSIVLQLATDQSVCSQPCNGDSNVVCGGNWLSNVYRRPLDFQGDFTQFDKKNMLNILYIENAGF